MTAILRHSARESPLAAQVMGATVLLTIALASSPRAAEVDILFTTNPLPMTEELLGPTTERGVAARFLPRHLAQRSISRGVAGRPWGDVELGGWNEATIVVNPTNPMNLACASLFELRVSTDGGTSWAPAVPPTAPSSHVQNGDPCLAFDSQGRLFWSYLASPFGNYVATVGVDLFVAQCDPSTGEILPGYPINVTEQIGLAAVAGNGSDKEWLAADCFAGSTFADRLYIIWTLFPPAGNTVNLTSFSSDHGMTWSPAVQLGGPEAYKLPTHITVAPNGDVYAAEHRQPGFITGRLPDGISGHVNVYRSTDGGATYPQSSVAYAPGEADMTFNVQADAQGAIPGTDFLLIGSVQPWVLADPNAPGRIYVVASDDPDNDVTTGDPADVYIVISTDHGQTWSSPNRIDSGPGTTFQVMPTATIDRQSGAIVVHYYDNRLGAVNNNGNVLLDVFATVSLDGGASFGQDFRVNDVPFDPDAGARCRYDCGPLMTDVWASGDSAYAVSASGHFLRFDGSVWSAISQALVPLWALWGSSNTDVFMCGEGGTILHYDGVQVTTETSGTSEGLYGMDGVGSDVYAVGANGTIVHHDGSSWSSVMNGTTEELHDVWVGPSGDVFVTGRSGTVLRCGSGGCSSISLDTSEGLGGIWGSSETDVYVVGWSGGLFHFDGSTWETMNSRLALLTDVWGSAVDDVIAVGWGQILRFDGIAWSRESVSEHLLWKMNGSCSDNIFVAGEHGFIGRYYGSSWTGLENPLNAGLLPTRRIGEYNGVAAAVGRTFAAWCGNTTDDLGDPLDQQAIFDTFDTPWQVGVSIVDLAHETSSVVLERARPNPSQGPTTFAYSLPRAEHVNLSLVDVRGRRVATLIHGEQPAGRHVVPWDGRNGAGNAVAPGLYFLRLEARDAVRTRKVVLAR